MTVKELIEALAACPQDADVGQTMTSHNGWILAVHSVKLATVVVEEGETLEQDVKRTIVCLDHDGSKGVMVEDELEKQAFRTA